MPTAKQYCRATHCLLSFRWVLLAAVWFLLAFPSASSACVPSDYSLDKTLQKLKPDFPFIHPIRTEATLDVRHWPERTYSTRGKYKLALDVFAPLKAASNKPLPGVILVHGGGWCAGSRTLMLPLAQQLAQRGYVVAAVSYSLTAQAPYPAAIEDVQAALVYFRKNAANWGLDPKVIALAGASSGGQIASLAALTLSKHNLDTVQAIINIDGLSDFTTPLALRYENDPARASTVAGQWLGGRYEEQPERWRAASPITHLTAAAPPMLFITGEAPRFSAGVEAMQAQLDLWHIANKREHFAKAPHSFWLFDPWFTPTLMAIDNFLRQQRGFNTALSPVTPELSATALSAALSIPKTTPSPPLTPTTHK